MIILETDRLILRHPVMDDLDRLFALYSDPEGILEYAFGHLALHRLICLMHPENAASQRVAQRIGMRHKGELDDMVADHFPTLIYSIESEP